MRWTEAETNIIRDKYPSGGCQACAPLLPARSKRSIFSRAAALQIKLIRWTEAEDNIIREHYPVGGYKTCAHLLPNRSEDTIYKRAQRLNVNGRRWTDAEDETIKEHYPSGGYVACLPFLPNRKRSTIISRAKTLKVKSENSTVRIWTVAEDGIIKEHYPNGGCRACVPLLPQRTKGAIAVRANTLKIKKIDPSQRIVQKGCKERKRPKRHVWGLVLAA